MFIRERTRMNTKVFTEKMAVSKHLGPVDSKNQAIAIVRVLSCAFVDQEST